MKFNIAIAVERKGKKVNALALEARTLLNKFDQNREVPEYRRYLETKEIRTIAERYKIRSDDMNSISSCVSDWYGRGKGGVDEKGIYELATFNPDGWFDDFEVFYYATPDEFEEKIVGKQEPLVVAFVTPAMEWVEGYWENIERAVMSSKENEYYAWKDKLRILLEKYKDCAIFIARCHA